MTPHSLAFYVDVVMSGAVLGARPTDSPDQVTAILGTDFAEDRPYGDTLARDYGLAEFFWVRESPDHPWEGHHFTLQVHRLAYGGGAIVNRGIRDRYGRFDRHLRFDKLRRLLANRGVGLEDVPDANAPAYTLHWQPASQVSVIAFRERQWGRPPRRGNRLVGDVNSISSSMTAGQVAWNRARYGPRDA
ncbi:hypothetical protein EF910_28280 [Streptomyces sp. WAC07149]|nr:hypothetical protein [Streptomyces lavendulae]RST01452.1 hypothetical protein EF910_28280 [Streptomyces sp. WAC07149]